MFTVLTGNGGQCFISSSVDALCSKVTHFSIQSFSDGIRDSLVKQVVKPTARGKKCCLDLVEKEKELHESAITISHWYHTILSNSILELVNIVCVSKINLSLILFLW